MSKLVLLNRCVKSFYGIFIFLLVMNNSAFAQKTYTTIIKNVNYLASNFVHELSTSQDSLVLESDVLFNKVCFLKDGYKKIFEFPHSVYKSKVPLNELPLGKYTVIFYDNEKIIVFRLSRLLAFEDYEDELLAYNVSTSYSSNLKSGKNYITNNITVAANQDYNQDEEKAKVNKNTYNITSNHRNNMQSRQEYRKNNLRPNGKPYD